MRTNHVSEPDRTRTSTRRKATVAAAVLMTTALVSPGQADDYADAFRLAVPTKTERDTGGMSQYLATGQMALRAVNAPSGVCPVAGEPTDGDFSSWFANWSLQGVGGFWMANNPASYQPLLVPTPVIGDGASRTFFIGAAPVKKVAMCVYPTAGDVSADDVEVTLLRRGLTAGACAPAANSPCELTQPIQPVLNSLFIMERINEPDVEYVITVEAPPAGSVGVHIGGRLGNYPEITTISN